MKYRKNIEALYNVEKNLAIQEEKNEEETKNSLKDLIDDPNNINNININFNFNNQNEAKNDESKQIENLNRLLILQNKILTTSIVQDGLREFFNKLRSTKKGDSHYSSCNSEITPDSSQKKNFSGLKVINSEIFEKIQIKADMLIHDELKSCFNKMKLNCKQTTNKKFKLSQENVYKFEFTDILNKFEELVNGNYSIESISFSLIPKKHKQQQIQQMETEKYNKFS